MHQRLLLPLLDLFSQVFEGIAWGVIAIGHWIMLYAITELFTDKDWERLLGESGFKAALIIGIVTVWATSKKVERDRHREIVRIVETKDQIIKEKDERCHEMAEKFITTSDRMANAVETFDRNSRLLYVKIDELPERLKKS